MITESILKIAFSGGGGAAVTFVPNEDALAQQRVDKYAHQIPSRLRDSLERLAAHAMFVVHRRVLDGEYLTIIDFGQDHAASIHSANIKSIEFKNWDNPVKQAIKVELSMAGPDGMKSVIKVAPIRTDEDTSPYPYALELSQLCADLLEDINSYMNSAPAQSEIPFGGDHDTVSKEAAPEEPPMDSEESPHQEIEHPSEMETKVDIYEPTQFPDSLDEVGSEEGPAEETQDDESLGLNPTDKSIGW
jgi:hypothetical protein